MCLVDVFTPCHGPLLDAWDNTGTRMGATCLWCVASRFIDSVKAMNMDEIQRGPLSDDELLEDFIDKGAMSLVYER